MVDHTLKENFSSTQKNWANQKILLWALGISIGLNVLILIIIKLFLPLAPVILRPVIAAKDYRPSWILTLAETPESARREKPSQQARHVSDKNAVAQNSAAPPDLPIGQPFAKGLLPEADSEARPAMTPGKMQRSKPRTASSDEVPARVEAARPTNGSNFRREFLTGEFDSRSSSSLASRSNAGLQNFNSRVPELGSFSLNTYAWEYAPYLLWLRNQVQRHIYPPPAFTHIGMISGRTILRFRINRNGTLQNLELIGYEGHKSLMETSVRAIQSSAPFRVLPNDFPEEYLEVTAQFDYIVHR